MAHDDMNTKNIERDDPRITAYALGERADLSAEETAAIEALLAGDAALRAECAELASLGRELAAEFAGEPQNVLSLAQRRSIARAARGEGRPLGRILAIGSAFAAAAALLLIVSTRLQRSVERGADERVARVDGQAAPAPDSRANATESSVEEFREAAPQEEKAAPAADVVVRKLDVLVDPSVVLRSTEHLEPFEYPAGKDGESGLPVLDHEGLTNTYSAGFHGVSAEVDGEDDGRVAGTVLVLEDVPALKGLGYSGGPVSPGHSGPSSPGPSGAYAPSAPVAGGRHGFYDEDGARHDDVGRRLRRERGEEWRYDHPRVEPNTESYDAPAENPFVRVGDDPLSTFSIDVDTASYANVRRFLTQGQLPPADAVRIEEMVNYFSYAYPLPAANEAPFSVSVEVAECPWTEGHRLMQVGLKGREFSDARERGRNLVFLVDVSGSMQPENKLPLVQRSLEMLLDHLASSDRVAIVAYAGNSGVVLPSTPAADRETIRAALANLRSGSSTNGGAGIELAYAIAQANFIQGGVNRVILATDGDFNVGVTDRGALVRLIEDKARSGVFLTVLGYGMGNLKDATMEQLADKGNGNYAYVDNLNEARKVLVVEADSTLETIAKDVKIQIEFNPAVVAAYRLVGYENRVLAHRDFNDDTKDAGEIGAGHTVTAIYEIVPVGKSLHLPGVDPLKYQQSEPAQLSDAAASGEMLTVKLRYKQPDAQESSLLEVPVHDPRQGWERATSDFRFAAAVAGFGMLLKNSSFAGRLTVDQVREMALEGAERDPFGYRHEFLQLVERARSLGLGRVR